MSAPLISIGYVSNLWSRMMHFKNVGDTDFKDGNNNIIPYSCVSGAGARTCTVNGKNPGIYTMNVKYYPKGPLESDPFTLVSAPFNQ
jgi:hypothetical protein